jgi:hypothetical protein
MPRVSTWANRSKGVRCVVIPSSVPNLLCELACSAAYALDCLDIVSNS